jgi:hypothetical protein
LIGSERTVVQNEHGKLISTFSDLTIYDFQHLVDGAD